MKLFVVPILILLIATQAFSKWIVLLEYNANKTYFARVLCENKAKPQLKCNGKCAMMKKMAEEESQDSRSGEKSSAKLKFAEVLFPFEREDYDLLVALLSQKTSPSTDRSWSCFTPMCSVFHPPLV